MRKNRQANLTAVKNRYSSPVLLPQIPINLLKRLSVLPPFLAATNLKLLALIGILPDQRVGVLVRRFLQRLVAADSCELLTLTLIY